MKTVSLRRIGNIGSALGVLFLAGCGASDTALEFMITDPEQSSDLSTVTATLTATETSEAGCDATSVTTVIILTMANGSTVEEEISLDEDVPSGESVVQEVSISTGGVQATNIETSDGSFTPKCGSTGLGF